MLAAVMILLLPHISIVTLSAIPLIIGYLIIGFWFGKITCSFHSRTTGLWITLGLFIVLNFFHSLIDGILIVSFSELYRNLALYSHELLRQPALYLLFWGMISPFVADKKKKVILSFIAITLIWLLGVYLGKFLGNYLHMITLPTLFFELFIFIFIGDIIHHLYDEFPGKLHNH